MPSTPIAISTLSEATLAGNGVFDVLMRANKAHLEAEFAKNRIKGPEYSTVYLGALQQVLAASVQFALTKQKAGAEAELLEKQILIAQVTLTKEQAEVAQITAQTALIAEQRLKVEDEILTGVNQREQLIAQTALLVEQKLKVQDDILTGAKQRDQLIAQTALVNQQKANALTENASEILKQAILTKEALKIAADTAAVTQQTINLISQKAQLDAQTLLINEQKANAVLSGLNLIKEGCKLDAEFDVLMAQALKVAGETSLLSQKTATERAQTTTLGVDDNSVMGRQKLLYQAQTDGFKRSSENAAAKLMVDSWAVRRTTDEGTMADATNLLNDATIGRAVNKMLTGVGA